MKMTTGEYKEYLKTATANEIMHELNAFRLFWKSMLEEDSETTNECYKALNDEILRRLAELDKIRNR